MGRVGIHGTPKVALPYSPEIVKKKKKKKKKKSSIRGPGSLEACWSLNTVGNCNQHVYCSRSIVLSLL